MGGRWGREAVVSKEKPVLFKVANKYSCRSWGRAVGNLVDGDEP